MTPPRRAKLEALGALLDELLRSTDRMRPSRERAVDALCAAIAVRNPDARRKLVTVAVHDLYEVAVRDAVDAVGEGAA